MSAQLRDTEAANSTRERLVSAARELFAEKGYSSTSIADILRKAEANAGSLYYFFPAKQDLLLAVLEHYVEILGPVLLAPTWEGVTDPIERIFALLERYRRYLVDTECLYGCPIGSLALELHEPDPVVREKLALNFDRWVDAVEGCLVEAGNHLPLDLNRNDLARFILTTMEGGVMQSRTHRTTEAFDASVRMLRRFFAELQRTGKSKARRTRTR
jgi:TetR/AcrR family transcriptional repressor of nem operon